jgi:hypothetical protein
VKFTDAWRKGRPGRPAACHPDALGQVLLDGIVANGTGRPPVPGGEHPPHCGRGPSAEEQRNSHGGRAQRVPIGDRFTGEQPAHTLDLLVEDPATPGEIDAGAGVLIAPIPHTQTDDQSPVTDPGQTAELLGKRRDRIERRQ